MMFAIVWIVELGHHSMFNHCFVNAVCIQLPSLTMTFNNMSSKTSTQAAANAGDAALKTFLQGWDAGTDGKQMVKDLVCHNNSTGGFIFFMTI
jgi:hypothetical protein